MKRHLFHHKVVHFMDPGDTRPPMQLVADVPDSLDASLLVAHGRRKFHVKGMMILALASGFGWGTSRDACVSHGDHHILARVCTVSSHLVHRTGFRTESARMTPALCSQTHVPSGTMVSKDMDRKSPGDEREEEEVVAGTGYVSGQPEVLLRQRQGVRPGMHDPVLLPH